MIFSPFPLIPMLGLFLWIGIIVYALLLAGRLVSAVERIAQAMPPRLPGPTEH